MTLKTAFPETKSPGNAEISEIRPKKGGPKGADYKAEYAGEKVSPSAGLPVERPFLSHFILWAEVPWVNESGTVRP